jgi:hypothetical protein
MEAESSITSGQFRSFWAMLITKTEKALLFLACALTCYCRATTVTVIATPSGIVMASDSGKSTRTGNLPSVKSTTNKFYVVQNHIVVSSVGFSDLGAVPGKGTGPHYNFLEWMGNIDGKLDPNISVDDLADIVERESAGTFSKIDDVLSAGLIKPRKELEDCRTFIQYIIAGYSHNSAKIYVINFYIDWDRKKLVGPKRILLFPSPEATGNYVFYSFGITEALDDVSNPDSYAYKTISLNCPAYRTLTARRDITITQSIAVAKEFVRVEEKTNPTEVFGPAIALAILPDSSILGLNVGRGKTLSKLKTGKQEKAHN